MNKIPLWLILIFSLALSTFVLGSSLPLDIKILFVGIVLFLNTLFSWNRGFEEHKKIVDEVFGDEKELLKKFEIEDK